MLSEWEQVVMNELTRAAREQGTCPTNLDLEMMLGCQSGSVAPSIVARLERKGLITVQRYQRFRTVTICATGETTARSPSMHVERPHVPRGAGSRSPAPTERKGYKRGRL